jgi:mycothiol synthase
MDAPELAVMAPPDRESVDEITELVDRVTASLGHRALSEHKRMELDRLARPSPGPVAPEETVGVVARASASAGGSLLGYAHLTGDRVGHHYAVEVVVAPEVGRTVGEVDQGLDVVAGALVDAVVEFVARKGGGSLRLWVAKASAVDDARAGAHGFVIERTLIQMRCPLSLPAPATPTGPAPIIETRAFRPGLDEHAWLATNNRAFDAHPEQGHWDLATLLDREQEPWFDPEGLLLLESEGRLAGSCWTKIHRDTDPPMGEIYVIGVDPDFRGQGLGRALTVAGLEWLAAQGLTLGMLYVDADNQVAVSMYRSMGFVADHVDRAYLRTVDPA